VWARFTAATWSCSNIRETRRRATSNVALPGDAIRIDHGQVIVNGKRLVEPYVPTRFSDDRSQPEMTIPDNEYFVMGDHRSISSDSRDFGPVERGLIYGKAAFVYWPMEQAGVVR
jgi:signal peptidase I